MTNIETAIVSCIAHGKRPRKACQYAKIKNRFLSISRLHPNGMEII